jgi:DNA (cytosine-5)-methyltransferase 1
MLDNGPYGAPRPRLLDLFCGAGGAAMGYHRAGFDIVGVDHRPQPRYPFAFVQADALKFPLEGFNAIHASPPCQGYLNERFRVTPSGHVRADHPRLIDQIRIRLEASGLPYVIENIPAARPWLREPIQLCGSSFGLAVRRHRLFESNAPMMALPCAHHLQTEPRYATQFRPKDRQNPLSCVVQVYGNGKGAMHWPAAMGIDWMQRMELAQAIPPAYTEHIGRYLLAELASSDPPLASRP